MGGSGQGDGAGREQVEQAAQAYIYGYPLVYNLRECAAFVAGSGGFPARAPYNEFGHVRDLADPDLKFVSPNNDTCYSVAVCDVRREPLVLHVPDTGGRYYVLQFVDAWTNNFAYIGRRATGTGEADYLLAGPGRDGDAPPGMPVVRAPSGVFVIVGRTQVDGSRDLPEVHALQDAFRLTPLSVYRGAGDPSPPAGIPEPDPRVGGELEWWERCRTFLAAFPPPTADAPFLATCRRLGLTEEESPYVGMDPRETAVLVAGAKAGQAKIEELMQQIHATPAGWQMTTHLFDYNLDHLGLGTIAGELAGELAVGVGGALLAGGGMKMGQVIGATDRLGGTPVDRPVHFGEVLATLYRQLGLDPNRTTIRDLAGRPQYLVDDHQPMRELI